jgi:hypothetical protein
MAVSKRKSKAVADAKSNAARFLQRVRDENVRAKAVKLVGSMAAAEVDIDEVIARIAYANKARALLRAVSAAVRTGTIPARWDNPETPGKLITTGLGQYDPRVAFQAAMRAAYSAGRYEADVDNPDVEVFVYRTMRDARVRDTHALLDGVALPKGAAWWDTHYPPNGWRCRCQAYGARKSDLKALRAAGVNVQTKPPQERQVERVNRATGERETLPASIEPGWGFNPAKRPEELAAMLANRMRILVEAPDDAL